MNRRGFSLLEVIGALAIAIVLMTSVIGLVLDAEKTARRTRVRAELANNGTILSEMLRIDLSNAGLGVPINTKNITTGVDQIPAAVALASPTAFGIVGDVPRPDGNFTTFGLLDDRPPTTARAVHALWHTESDGGCVPSTFSTCTTSDTSLLFPGVAGCADLTQANAAQRSCPWGLRRLRGGEPFQVMAGNRQWFSATNNTTLTVDAVGPNGLFMVNLGSSFPAAWTNDSSASLPNAGTGQGWVSTIDRVFYKFNATARTVERIQCWGVPNAAAAAWPPATVTTLPANPCTGFQGLPDWEVVARDVQSASFNYFDGADVEVVNPATATAKASIRRIEYTIVLQKTAYDQAVRHEVIGGVFLSKIIL